MSTAGSGLDERFFPASAIRLRSLDFRHNSTPSTKATIAGMGDSMPITIFFRVLRSPVGFVGRDVDVGISFAGVEVVVFKTGATD